MTERENIDDFNKCAAFVLSSLYDNFPVPTGINCHSLQDADDPERILTVENDRRSGEPNPEKDNLHLVSKVDEVELILNRYTWTVQFLIREKYIHDLDIERKLLIQNFRGNAPIPTENSFIFPKLVLTAKGLAILNGIPESINGSPSESLISRLKRAIRNQSVDSVRELITSMIGTGAGVIIS